MTDQSRGRFLGAGAAAIGGAELAGMWRSSSAAGAAADRPYDEGPFGTGFTGEVFFLETAGADGAIKAGWVSEVDGGHATSDIVVEKLGAEPFAKKHISNVKYEDISVSSAVGGVKGMYDWIKASLDREAAAVDGAIVGCTLDGLQRSRGEFHSALLTEITVPALEGASKEPAYFTVKLSPESTSVKPAAGKPPLGPAGLNPKPVTWKLGIDGIDTTRVSKIDSFTIKQSIEAASDGTTNRVPGRIEIPNISFYLPAVDAQPFLDWFDDFVIQGNNGDDKERGAVLSYFNPKEISIASLTFKNVGIFKVTPEKVESHSDNIRRVKAEMYCEDIRFDYKAAWA